MESPLPLDAFGDHGPAIFYIAGLLFLGLTAFVSLLTWLFGRARTPLPGVSPWRINTSDFLAFTLCLIAWMLLVGLIAQSLRPRDENGDVLDPSTGLTLLVGFLMQLGLALVFFVFRAWFRTPEERSLNLAFITWRKAFVVGLFSLLAAIPVVYSASLLWVGGLTLGRTLGLDIDLDPQTPVEMFRDAEALWQIIGLGFLAVIVAPVAEEIVFRAGIYRFLRGHASLTAAALINGFIFGFIHFNLQSFLPLAIFGALLCVAYEWTGNIRVPIIMHALFNLNTLIILHLHAG